MRIPRTLSIFLIFFVCIFNNVKWCIFVFCEFLDDVRFLEIRNNIFEENSLKAFLRQSFRVFDFSNLSSDSRYLESVTLNIVNLYRGMSKLKLKISLNVPQLLCTVVSVALNGEFELFGEYIHFFLFFEHKQIHCLHGLLVTAHEKSVAPKIWPNLQTLLIWPNLQTQLIWILSD